MYYVFFVCLIDIPNAFWWRILDFKRAIRHTNNSDILFESHFFLYFWRFDLVLAGCGHSGIMRVWSPATRVTWPRGQECKCLNTFPDKGSKLTWADKLQPFGPFGSWWFSNFSPMDGECREYTAKAMGQTLICEIMVNIWNLCCRSNLCNMSRCCAAIVVLSQGDNVLVQADGASTDTARQFWGTQTQFWPFSTKVWSKWNLQNQQTVGSAKSICVTYVGIYLTYFSLTNS